MSVAFVLRSAEIKPGFTDLFRFIQLNQQVQRLLPSDARSLRRGPFLFSSFFLLHVLDALLPRVIVKGAALF